jgi:mannose-1-phosphate guanylyltransferase
MSLTPSFVLEPDGRGTAPALILAAMTLQEQEGLMLVMPSDHAIPDPDGLFPDFIEEIMHHAMNTILLIGVEPTALEPRYGYIEVDREKRPPYPVFGFKEKPQTETAREMIEEGNCLWNTGMFLAPPALFLERCASLKPRLYNEVKSAFEQGRRDKAVFRPHRETYLDVASQSIDRAILQRCPDLKCCPLALPWYDVGCWSMFLRLKLRRFLNGRL